MLFIACKKKKKETKRFSYLIIVHTFAAGVAVDADETMSGKRDDYFRDLLLPPLRLLQLLRLERVFVDEVQSHHLFHT